MHLKSWTLHIIYCVMHNKYMSVAVQAKLDTHRFLILVARHMLLILLWKADLLPVKPESGDDACGGHCIWYYYFFPPKCSVQNIPFILLLHFQRHHYEG
jgi:hypothetical protein